MGIIDEAGLVRKGEELDQEKVVEFLNDSIPGLKGEIEIKQFPGGFSNLTYLVKSGDYEMVLRRPPFGKKARTAHDMSREYRILKALKPQFPCAPEVLVYSEDESVMGAPFYVMERVKGIILRKTIPDGVSISPSDAGRLCENLVSLHSKLHKVDYIAAGLENFGKPEGYVFRQVDGWSKRYIAARTPDAPDFEKVMQWLHDKIQKDSSNPGVIHGDYKFDNVVLNPENPLEIIGVLDWEMATIGDPLMDLGSSLAYWVNRDDPQNLQMIKQLCTTEEGMLSRKEIIKLYGDMSGVNVENFDFYYCFGLFRLAVIAQQIYYRFFHGQTADKRFAMLIHAVKILESTALDLIEKSEI
ncbi:MAG: phosphotransferase family protein [Spirochaetota bacterium]